MFDMQDQCGGASAPSMHSMPLKRCSHCKTSKPLKDFNLDKRSKDGLQLWCKACKSTATAAWAKSNRKRKNATDATFKRRRRDRDRAHCTVKRAIKAGALEPLEYCERCEKPGPVEAHHEDYGKPLDVVWLCLTCHGQAHSEEGLT